MKPFIVAEMSANHLGSLERALAIVDAAAAAGADAVKLQTWDTMVLDEGYEIQDGPWAGRNLKALYDEAKTPWDWHAQIFERCRRVGVMGFSTAFDGASVEFLELLHCPMYKVASFEIVDLPLIEKIARTGKPMVISTGMATKQEILDALESAKSAGALDANVTLLACTSAYPATAAQARLGRMYMLERITWGQISVGLSDHTEGIGVAVAAAARGADMIEKHLTIARADGGPDAGFSLEPAEFKQLVIECRRAYEATNPAAVQYELGPQDAERPQLSLRRSLYIARDVKAGHYLESRDVRSARPALGMPPSALPRVIGRKMGVAATRGTPLTAGMLA